MAGYYIKRTNITADRDVIIIGKRLICGENAEPFDSVKSAKSAISKQKKQDEEYCPEFEIRYEVVKEGFYYD